MELIGDAKCLPSEFDCEDAVCIDLSLRCNGRVNCRFRYDEDNCKVLDSYQKILQILQILQIVEFKRFLYTSSFDTLNP